MGPSNGVLRRPDKAREQSRSRQIWTTARSGAPRRFGCEPNWLVSRAEGVRRNRRLIQSAVARCVLPARSKGFASPTSPRTKERSRQRSAACLKPQRSRQSGRCGKVPREVSLLWRYGVGHSAVRGKHERPTLLALLLEARANLRRSSEFQKTLRSSCQFVPPHKTEPITTWPRPTR